MEGRYCHISLADSSPRCRVNSYTKNPSDNHRDQDRGVRCGQTGFWGLLFLRAGTGPSQGREASPGPELDRVFAYYYLLILFCMYMYSVEVKIKSRMVEWNDITLFEKPSKGFVGHWPTGLSSYYRLPYIDTSIYPQHHRNSIEQNGSCKYLHSPLTLRKKANTTQRGFTNPAPKVWHYPRSTYIHTMDSHHQLSPTHIHPHTQ